MGPTARPPGPAPPGPAPPGPAPPGPAPPGPPPPPPPPPPNPPAAAPPPPPDWPPPPPPAPPRRRRWAAPPPRVALGDPIEILTFFAQGEFIKMRETSLSVHREKCFLSQNPAAHTLAVSTTSPSSSLQGFLVPDERIVGITHLSAVKANRKVAQVTAYRTPGPRVAPGRSNSKSGCCGQCVAEPSSVCARRSEAVPEALGRLGMRAGGSGPQRSGQAAAVGWARHTPAGLPREPGGGRVAGSLRHDGAGAAARGLAVGGSSSSRVSNRAVQQRKQNHCVRKRSCSKNSRRGPARWRQRRHSAQAQSWISCSANANRFSVASRLARPWLPCPKLRLML